MPTDRATRLAALLVIAAALAGCGGRAGLDTGPVTNGSGSTSSTNSTCSSGSCTTPGASCDYQGGLYPNGLSWTCDACGNTCTCQDGLVSTTGVGCGVTSTYYTSTYYLTSTSYGASCTNNGGLYANGAAWVCDACGNTCYCNNGSVTATSHGCYVTTTTTTTSTTVACTYGGTVEPDYSTWSADGGGCSISCFCDGGAVQCTHCPACWYNGVTYPSGATWTCSDGCNACRCSSGQVIATAVPCYYGGDGGVGIGDASVE